MNENLTCTWMGSLVTGSMSPSAMPLATGWGNNVILVKESL